MLITWHAYCPPLHTHTHTNHTRTNHKHASAHAHARARPRPCLLVLALLGRRFGSCCACAQASCVELHNVLHGAPKSFELLQPSRALLRTGASPRDSAPPLPSLRRHVSRGASGLRSAA